MTIQFVAPAFESDPDQRTRELDLFTAHLSLLLDNSQKILLIKEYFFCPLSFASCSFPYIGGSGWLRLGHLFLGWGDGILLEPCPTCGGNVLVFRFSGSILTGSNSWAGLCSNCRTTQANGPSWHKPFLKRAEFGAVVRAQYPDEIINYDEYDGQRFDWGGDGLAPVRKRRPVSQPTCDAVSLDTLCDELQRGTQRTGSPPHKVSRKFSMEIDLLTVDGQRLQSNFGGRRDPEA